MATRNYLLLNPTNATDLSNAIEIQSFSWGISFEINIGSAGGGAGTGKAKLQPLTVVKRPDKSSANLFQTIATGGHFDTATLLVVTSGASTLRYDFTLVFPTNFVTQGSQGETPLEEVTFAFGAVTLK